MLALRDMVSGIGTEMGMYKELQCVPQDKVRNFRNDMYVVSEALRLMQKSGNPKFAAADAAVLKNYKTHIDNATKFIPTWVKVAVALALGLGTMIGWKRIVVTVGEKIGKDHLTYGQGARGGNHGDVHHRRGGLVRDAGEYHPRAFIRRGRNDGCQPHRTAIEHGAKSRHGVGADPSRFHYFVRPPSSGLFSKIGV